jgi:hypothetical protein
VRRRENAHLRSGRFDQHAMITYAIVGGIRRTRSIASGRIPAGAGQPRFRNAPTG